MSNYTKTVNFATKDNLSPGNPLKIVKGTEIDTEYNNIATAVATKTDNASAAITGGTIVGITDLAVADGGTGASSITSNSVILGNGSSALSGNLVAPSTSGNVLTSNGTNWAADGKDAVIAITRNNSGTTRGQSIGLTLHNENNTTNSYSPAITFSAVSNSGGYNSMYAAIMGKKTGQNAGVDTNWNFTSNHTHYPRFCTKT